MSIARSIMEALREANARVSLDGENLRIDFEKGAIDNQLISVIKKNKELLKAYIGQIKGNDFLIIPELSDQSSYALSSAQRRMWFVSQFEEANVAYNMPGTYVMEGNVNRLSMERSLGALVARHEILRTVFREDGSGEVRQYIKSSSETGFSMRYKDMRGCAAKEDEVLELIQGEIMMAFDLSSGPLLRVNLLQLEERKYVFVYVMHHIISDGWSMEVLIRELLTLYNAYSSGKPDGLRPLRIQYKDYAAWQLSQLSSEGLSPHKDYWLSQLGGELPLLDFPSDRVRPAIKTYNGSSVEREIKKSSGDKFKMLVEESGGTLFMGLLGVVNVLLYRYTGQEDIIVGSGIAGRDHFDLEDQIGFYVNTLALRTRFNGEDSYRSLMDKVRQVTLGAYEHQMYPFDELVNLLEVQRDTGRNPLFDVMVTLQNIDLGHKSMNSPELDGIRVSGFKEGGHVISKFDLMFTFIYQGGSLHTSIEYNSDIFYRETVERLSAHLEQILEAVVAHPDESLRSLDYLSKEERDRLLYAFNDTRISYAVDKTLVELFEGQVLATPEDMAVTYEEDCLSYKELNARSNQLAHYLRNRYDLKANDLVGVRLRRGLDMVISILGVLKSGGAYIPIDPDYPEERVEYMVSDSGCKVVIDESELGRYRGSEEENGDLNLTGVNSPRDLAYVIYTSGTTGNPKGVMVEHRGVVRLVSGNNYVSIGKGDRLLSLSNFFFDGSVFDLFGCLLSGASLVIPGNEVLLNPSALGAIISEKKISVFFVTTALFNSFVDNNVGGGDSLRCVLFGGEQVSVSHVERFKSAHREIDLIHVYGPTENTTFSTYYPIKEVVAGVTTIPIGSGISNTQCYVLTKDRWLQPIGVVGELYLGGDGLARGYLNNPELTADKFVANPFLEGELLYRTGDLVRWLDDGNLEFMGRNDDQVKIRGYRIELGEIERELSSHESIEAVVVLARGELSGGKELVAYFTFKKQISRPELRAYLSTRLPVYMIPSYYVPLDHFPLTSNGKVDRKSLPSPGEAGSMNTDDYVAPGNEIEERLVKIWSEVLGISENEIGIRHNFFDLGGHSLKAIQMQKLIVREFDRKEGVLMIFKFPTIRDQADYLTNEFKNSGVSEELIQASVNIMENTLSLLEIDND